MRIKVLLVDDEKLERVLIRKGFDWEKNGFDIIGEASSAAEALEFIEHRRPQLVLTDISMPRMDGLELSTEILKKMPECRIVIVTGYREFEYAQRAVRTGVKDFLLKPVNMEDIERITSRIRKELEQESIHLNEVEELRKTVLADRNIVMESFFQCLVEDRVEEEEAVHKLTAYNCQDMLSQCVCVNIMPEGEDCKKITELINEMEWERTVCFIHYMNHVLLYFFRREYAEVPVMVSKLYNAVLTRLGMGCTVGISLENNGFGGISRAFRQSGRALNAAVFLGNNRIITCEEFEEILKKNPDRKEISWEEFVFAVQNGLEEKAYGYVEEYMEHIKTYAAADREYLGLMCMNMLSRAGATLNRYGVELIQIPGEENVYEEIRHMSAVNEAEQYLKEKIRRIIDFHEEKKVRQGNKTVRDALTYLSQNIFDPELSLKSVAAGIYTNESYLSRSFKKEQGISLIEYITKKRIEESIRLLRTTDLKAYEIADQIGFKDPHYFSICFKKQTGVTIKEYKK